MALDRPVIPLTQSGPVAGAAGVRHEGFELPAHATAVADARRRVGGSLRAWGLSEDLSRTAQLVVSEFFTNAVVHTDSCRVRCRIELFEERLRIEVCDEGVDCSEVLPRSAAVEDVNGRGLQLVGVVAERWGVRPGSGESGRIVWAELRLSGL
ncbi:ATP-binding protein [Streptomyces albidus (ex Kaewkla and Franco 2022)]|uniref:ATP-binding protein n=1 Tax=Streptomyces albidus (ex Kaewkla and Franco 2022) TaxID=722709 RepID=UPI0015EF3C1E|nr:ATP-binding protein [Streptomyces albidus (ex Kaewkla and Franco 2022)]